MTKWISPVILGLLLTTVAFAQVEVSQPVNKQTIEGYIDESMQRHDALESTYWDGDKMRPEVQASLKKTGLQYFGRLEQKLPCVKLKDILFTGSLSNYNYTSFSDVDLHLTVDIADCKCKALVSEYITLMNYYHHETEEEVFLRRPMQVTVIMANQDKGQDSRYSVLQAKWVVMPEPGRKVPYSKQALSDYVMAYHEQIRELKALFHTDPKAFDCERAQSLFSKLKQERAAGLKGARGYDSIENTAYRVIRSVGDLSTLYDLSLCTTHN